MMRKEGERVLAKQQQDREKSLAKHHEKEPDVEHKKYNKAWKKHAKAEAEHKTKKETAQRVERKKIMRKGFHEKVAAQRLHIWGDESRKRKKDD
jgi:hypothetical protein